MIPDIEAISVEDAAISRILHEQLRQALTLLTPAEQKLIKQIYFQNRSERQVPKESGVPYMTVHNRKVRILKKLFNMLK